MRALKALAGLVLLGLIALVVFEVLSPVQARRSAKSAAAAVAQAAAHQIFLDRSKAPDLISTDAKAAAVAKAQAEHVTLTAFSIDPPEQLVHVTINKQARSIIVKHTMWRHFDSITVSATANPS
jgi:Tfp pilus assembly protein PilX